MKATFNNFLTENPNCSGFVDKSDAITIFNILSEDKNIIKMIDYSEQGHPALSACVATLEAWYDSQSMHDFSFEEDFNKMAVGRIIKTILAPFGYEVSSRKAISKKCGSKYFSSASCYRMTGTPKMVVKKIIVPVE
ncbi:MAG: hypothetical protein ACI4F9_11490 [Lachnospiraceae bacterium]